MYCKSAMLAYNVQDEPLLEDRPLFGVSTRRERLLNLVIGLVTTLCVIFTLLSAFIFPISPSTTFHFENIAFAACIVFVCASLLQLINWYRQGDVDPKFRKMIYYNSATIVLLCICANWFFFKVTDASDRSCNVTTTQE